MSQHTLAHRVLVIGVPAAFAVLSVFHPMPDPIAGLADQVNWWITQHALQIPMFLLMGCAILALGWASSGRAVTVSRVAALVFIAFYPAYDAFAGLGSGYLVRHAEGTDAATQTVLFEATAGIFDSPINAGLYAVGTLAWMVAVVSLGVALRRGPGGLAVTILFIASGLTLIDHGGVFGVVSFTLFAAAAALHSFARGSGPGHGTTAVSTAAQSKIGDSSTPPESAAHRSRG
jgi:uncharacterized membrane protein YGL010W